MAKIELPCDREAWWVSVSPLPFPFFLIYFPSSPISFPENLPTRCLFFLPPLIFSRARTDFFLFFLLRFTHRPPPLSRLSLLPSRSSSPCLLYRTHFSPSYLSPFFFVLFWELSPHCLSLLFVGLLSLKLPSLYFYFLCFILGRLASLPPFFKPISSLRFDLPLELLVLFLLSVSPSFLLSLYLRRISPQSSPLSLSLRFWMSSVAKAKI